MGVAVWVWDDGNGRHLALRDSESRPIGVPDSALEGDTDPTAWREEILDQLDILDRKSIRAIREGNQSRIDEIESQAALMRDLLRSLP